MKRIYSLLALMAALLVSGLNASAQSYTKQAWEDEYSNSAVFYIDLTDADGQSITGNYFAATFVNYAIGAFVNGEQRGVGYAQAVSDTRYVFQVRVWGDASEEAFVVFRIQQNGIEYWLGGEMVTFANDPTFGEPSKPLQYQFVPITGIEPNNNPIEVMVGQTAGFGWHYLPEGYTNPVTEMETTYNYESGENYFILHPESLYVEGVAKGEDEVVIQVRPPSANIPFETTVTIKVLAEDVSVEGITSNDESTDITLWVGEQFEPSYTITPENATNQNVVLTVGNESVLSAGEGAVEAIAKGTSTLTVTTEDGGFSLVYNITVKQPVKDIQFKDLTIVRDTKVPITEDMFTYEPEDADFDISQLHFYFDERISEGLAGLWVLDDNTFIGFTPYSDYIVSFEYGELDTDYYVGGEFTVNVLDKVQFDSGWNWLGLPRDVDAQMMYDALGDKFVEARSKTQLIYNDAAYGLFGDLWSYTGGTGYKVKTNAAADFTQEVTDDAWLYESVEATTTKGWNWLGNCLPRAMSIENIISEAFDGDIVKTLDGLATYTEGEGWSSPLVIEEHAGFLYKSGEANLTLEFNPNYCFDDEDYTSAIINGNGGANGIKTRSFWRYDAGAYPSNMGIIAAADELADAERYTIGAFVGDECRGQGTLQKGKWFIVAHAQGGEQISLRLYDRLTGRYSDLAINGAESIRFAEMAGSSKAPLQLSVPEADGVVNLNANVNHNASIYNLAGQRLTKPHKGINIINGEKVVVR